MTPNAIITMCSVALNVPEGSIMSKNRKETVAFCRHVAMSLIREVCRDPLGNKYTYGDIGKMFGDKDHGTVMHACERIANLHPADKRRPVIERLRREAGVLPEQQFQTLLGKTVLLRNGDGSIVEAKVKDLTGTAEYVCLEIDNRRQWSPSAKWAVIEELTSHATKRITR